MTGVEYIMSDASDESSSARPALIPDQNGVRNLRLTIINFIRVNRRVKFLKYIVVVVKVTEYITP